MTSHTLSHCISISANDIVFLVDVERKGGKGYSGAC